MKAILKAAILVFIGLAFPGGAQALSLAEGAQPAEYPPADYSGDVYVDSRGCIYIRAGYGGNVTWVPRVTRDRQVVCGATPTLAGASTQIAAVAPAPSAAPSPSPVPRSAPDPQPSPPPAPASARAPAASTPAIRPISRTVTLTCPAEGADKQVRTDGVTVILRCKAGQSGTISYVVRTSGGERVKVIVKPPAPVRVAAPPVPAPAPVTVPRVVVTTSPAPDAAPVAAAAPASTICPGRTGVSRAYTSSTRAVRCGPQQVPAVTYSAVPGSGSRAVTVTPPPGYRVAWQDGRLNPNRGPQGGAGTASDGRAASGSAGWDLIWSQTVPYRLMDITTGRDVTALFPGVQYPNMPTEAQIAAASAGARVVVGSSSAPAVQTAAASQVAVAAPVAAAAPAAAPAATGTAYRYVQVAMFGVPANARRTVARLSDMGLSMRIVEITRNGKRYELVMAGPYLDRSSLNSALAQVRAAGFSDAYLRR